MTKGLKYAALLIPTVRDEEAAVRHLAPDINTWIGKLSDHVEGDRIKHWQGWLGSMTWDRFANEELRVVFVSMESNSSTDDDKESVELRSRLEIAWTSLLLTDHARISRDPGRHAWIISGQAAQVDPVRLVSIKHYGPKTALPRPFYVRRSAFTKAYVKSPWKKQDADWPDEWERMVTTLTYALKIGLPPILLVALVSYDSALTQGRIDFRVPAFVRAAECILAVPIGNKKKKTVGGRQGFAKHALKIAPNLKNHWYVGGNDLHARLLALYMHRNECAHGMLPFPDLYTNKASQAEDGAVRAEYLAEIIARDAIVYALQHPASLRYFTDRKQLEAAWQEGSFP